MRKRKLVIITDCVDVASNEIRANIFKHIKDSEIEIEPVVPVFPFSLINATFILRLLADVYPENTIFYVVVNPIKGEPERIAGKTKEKNLYFIGRNTGVFSWLISDLGCSELYEIPVKSFVPFGGKFIYPEFIYKIIKNNFKDKIWKKLSLSKLRKINFSKGTLLHIDNFGLMKIMGEVTLFDKMGLMEGQKVRVRIMGKKSIIATYRKRMMGEDDGEWVVYQGSSLGGLPELGKVRMTDGPKRLNVKIGDKITFEKIK